LVRFLGTIVGVEDVSPHWPGSRWRSLKVISLFPSSSLFQINMAIRFHYCFLHFIRFNGMILHQFQDLIGFHHGR
jgi:hypothetical protein